MTRSPYPDLDQLPRIPRDADGPVFREPWEAHAFGMAVALHERGLFGWKEFADHLAAQIAAAGASDDGTHYYRHWLAALEALVAARRLLSADELAARKDEWDRAARATPHGQPIELARR
jgi:nitrile hydratase accessory protein